ncbi:WapI family immunity protein [Cardinium endosymbiont of Culicoides punctatus]|uniref:WapI family immunity protein n=1 Tax=Cardinium endosymbiont of Culicoides punctatus TaxID=2304601 RepID=UPI0010590064|nr:hypothetical protein [Cardinium endosymbiont of Culicoides punctatus]TDG93822.1 hypothetical protein CCPUN_08600 [Cardinium endosymbiont of Culicoides punctatus]
MILEGNPGKLTIEIVDRIYPDRDPKTEDGQWVYVDFLVDIECFSARIYHAHLLIGELQVLYNELDKLLNELEKAFNVKNFQDFEVDFWTLESVLLMKAGFTKSGDIIFDITIQNNSDKLSFSLNVNVASLEDFLRELFVELQKYTNQLPI